MPNLNRRVEALETGQGDNIDGPRVIWVNAVSPMNDAGEYPRRLGFVFVIGKRGREGEKLSRTDGEPLRSFLERVAAVYEPLHGPVPDGWYERDAA